MSESKKLSVLVVDDEQHICDLIEVMLKSFNIFSFIVSLFHPLPRRLHFKK